jgi:hypothetical protein
MRLFEAVDLALGLTFAIVLVRDGVAEFRKFWKN